MQIQVKCSCGAENCPEWAIIELQGVVEVQPSFQDSLQNLTIGQLCRPSSQESYTFTVGYHELTGSKVALKKPMLVLKKIKCMDGDQSDEATSSRVELDVVGVIRHKILFKNRPKALISGGNQKPRKIIDNLIKHGLFYTSGFLSTFDGSFFCFAV
ncbi:PREDICTED: putative uncharacterized protein DDB_G0287975 isoform X1 [Theobroma cacao]|uniref:Chromosome transmission fidelity protein 8 n=1 Tax=Theobroma cacao TaxID=3641 RepID=A0AB32W2R8_THECC|nr:PREDICTED: putative uncharacterized protein DDB_G0287975 isoform X1 [Theobroma cacao]